MTVATEQNVTKVKDPIKEDLRITENGQKSESFIRKLGSDPLLSPGCTEALRPLDAHQLAKEQRMGGGAFMCFENLMEVDQNRSGTSSRVTRLLYTSMTWKPTAVFSSAFPRRQPICEIQEMKHLQQIGQFGFANY